MTKRVMGNTPASGINRRDIEAPAVLAGANAWAQGKIYQIRHCAPAMIDQFDSDVVSFQLGYALTFVFGWLRLDQNLLLRARNHCYRPCDPIAGKDSTRFVVVALHSCELP
jgi:hypothetical protein